MQKLFLSHIHEDSKLAIALKDWIEGGFAGQVDVFVSSDSRSLVPGVQWLEKIRGSLTNSVAMLILCSPASVARPWLNFEAGVGWEKEVPVIPICHSGQTKGDLPLPLSTFHALDLNEERFSLRLIEALSRHLGFSKTPKLDFDRMRQELLALRSESPVNELKPPILTPQIQPEEIEILVELAKTTREISMDALAKRFMIEPQKMQYYLDGLKDQKLIGNRLAIGSPITYRLSKEGRRLLVDLGRL